MFLSPTGVARVLESLSAAEIAALWLLRLYDRDVDVAYFARVYDRGEADNSTFTRRYKDVFEAVQHAGLGDEALPRARRSAQQRRIEVVVGRDQARENHLAAKVDDLVVRPWLGKDFKTKA